MATPPVPRRCVCGKPREGIRPGAPPHPNVKYCRACRQARLQAPASTITPEQQEAARPLLGTMPRHAIAAAVGCTHAALNRWLRTAGLASDSRSYGRSVIDAVVQHYERHGLRETQAAFPTVKVRSIVERYPHAFRHTHWQPAQLVEAARMAGLVSPYAQARYFGRPNAFAGSINSVWSKVFRCRPLLVNALPFFVAWSYVLPGVVTTAVRQQHNDTPRAVILWLDLVPSLRPRLGPELVEAFEALSAFQQRLHGTTDSAAIRAMITERESRYGSPHYAPDPGTV